MSKRIHTQILALLFAIGLQSKHIEEKCFRKKSFWRAYPTKVQTQETNTWKMIGRIYLQEQLLFPT